MNWFFVQSSLMQAVLTFLIVGIFALAMIILTMIVSRFARATLSGVSASMLSPIGALFGLTAAFLGSSVAQNHADAVVASNLEARSLSESWVVAQNLPDALRSRVQGDIQAYINAVVRDEWPMMVSIRSANNPVSNRTRGHLLDAVHAAIIAEAAGPSLAVNLTGDELRDAFEARSSRINVAVRLINNAQFASAFVLGLLLIALVAIVHHAARLSQFIAVGLISMAVATAIATIAVQDNPFSGYLAVSADDFAQTASYGTNFTVDPSN
jgi:hypothetical protein